jgi:peptidase E
LHALIRWKEIGLDLVIKEASLKGTVLCGGSAGAGCWFSSLHTDSLRPDNTKNREAVINELSEEELEDWDYAKISGLGFIDAMCVPHFDKSGTNGNARSDDAEKILLANPTTPAIGVDENAALVVVGNDAYAVSGDGEATCHVVVPDEQNAGETFTAPLPTDWEEPIPMEELLEFATPATGEHLEALEDHVDTDFVIADDVVDIVEKAMANQQRKGRKSVDVPIVKLVAAGSGAALQLVPLADEIVKISGTELPNILYIGTASFDRTDKYHLTTKLFRAMGCEIRRLDVSEEADVPTETEMRECVLDWADIIMCSGGNTLHALIRWKDVGLDFMIKEASLKGTVLCGSSSGAGVWFRLLHTDSLRPDNMKNREALLNELNEHELCDWEYTKISGLGYMNAMFVPHYNSTGSNGRKRAEDVAALLQEDPSIPVIGVENNAALFVIGNEAYCFSGDDEDTCHLIVSDENGEVLSTPLNITAANAVPADKLLELPQYKGCIDVDERRLQRE